MKKFTIYNNLTKKKETYDPKGSKTINIYTCGPTVYDDSHIGHARSAITWDFIVRYLRFLDYDVIWTRNITDIDDKIINKAKELNIHPDKVARIYTFSFHEDMLSLNIEWPDFEPKATQHLHEMYDFIKKLINKNAAYQINNDVYFSVKSFKNYGQLKGQSFEELEKGFGRIEPNPNKRHPLDFALWKGITEANEYGFESPWGKGRPGWHLECSTMNFVINNKKIDIHGGGDDLIFPHHENEIAQSEMALDCPFARYWIHNGMIMVNGKKMAKSEGNYLTIKDTLKLTTGNALRLFVLNSHYKMPLNYTKDGILSAQNGINRLLEAISDIEINTNTNTIKIQDEYTENFTCAMSDDFNSPQALAVMFKLADNINLEKNKNKKNELQQTLLHLLNILGFNLLKNKINPSLLNTIMSNLINELLDWRASCKKNMDFKSSDKIRSVLNNSNIEIKDLSNNKFTWNIKI